MPHTWRSDCPPGCTTRRYEGRHTGAGATYPTWRSCALPSRASTTLRSAVSGSSSLPSLGLPVASFSGNAAERTLLPPCSMTASVARKSPTSAWRILKRTSSFST